MKSHSNVSRVLSWLVVICLLAWSLNATAACRREPSLSLYPAGIGTWEPLLGSNLFSSMSGSESRTLSSCSLPDVCIEAESIGEAALYAGNGKEPMAFAAAATVITRKDSGSSTTIYGGSANGSVLDWPYMIVRKDGAPVTETRMPVLVKYRMALQASRFGKGVAAFTIGGGISPAYTGNGVQCLIDQWGGPLPEIRCTKYENNVSASAGTIGTISVNANPNSFCVSVHASTDITLVTEAYPGEAQSVVDPYVYIDPSFPNAQDYQVVAVSQLGSWEYVPVVETHIDLDEDGYLSDVDCDDNVAETNPGAIEICDDGIDNDCDTLADEADGQCGICMDSDGDGWCDEADNCIYHYNPDQLDSDSDGVGDVCDNDTDVDSDADGVADLDDNCPLVANSDQSDSDVDGEGDACDIDDDNDSVSDTTDNCPFSPNPNQSDYDSDGIGDVCDDDPDGDNVVVGDNCPISPNPYQVDSDLDGVGDVCDDDDDNDGICDASSASNSCTAGPDNCPVTANSSQEDSDQDGIGDACDADIDGDGILNASDNCPAIANPDQNDTDGDSLGDACDLDDDGDGVLDADDNCPFVSNLDQADLDGDLKGDACDSDLDGDGVETTADNCPTLPNSDQSDLDADGIGDSCDSDIDGDGVANAVDLCPATPLGSVIDPNVGCSLAQLCPCEGPRGTTTTWRNHGKFVSCVAHSVKSFVELGLMDRDQGDRWVSNAAISNCGK